MGTGAWLTFKYFSNFISFKDNEQSKIFLVKFPNEIKGNWEAKAFLARYIYSYATLWASFKCYQTTSQPSCHQRRILALLAAYFIILPIVTL